MTRRLFHWYSIQQEETPLPSATPKPISRAEAARNALGLTLAQAAEKARVCTRYLRSVELRGGAAYILAERLAWIYKAPITVFLLRRGVKKIQRKRAVKRSRKRETAQSPTTFCEPYQAS